MLDAVSNYSTSRVERKTKNGDGLERIGWSGSSYRTVVVVAAFHDALSHLSLVRLSPLVCNVKKRKERERERNTVGHGERTRRPEQVAYLLLLLVDRIYNRVGLTFVSEKLSSSTVELNYHRDPLPSTTPFSCV